MSKLKYLILFSFCLFFDNCLEIKGYQSLILYELSSKYVGKKGTLVINLSSITDVEEDTTRAPFFNVNLSNGKSVECGVWIPGKYKSYIFCNIGTDIPAGNYTLNFENIQFTYKDWVISFQNSRKYEFEKLDKELIDLYSNKQTIYIVEGEDSYKLNFNLVSYNQEAVILQTLGLVFMDCEQGNSELI